MADKLEYCIAISNSTGRRCGKSRIMNSQYCWIHDPLHPERMEHFGTLASIARKHLKTKVVSWPSLFQYIIDHGAEAAYQFYGYKNLRSLKGSIQKVIRLRYSGDQKAQDALAILNMDLQRQMYSKTDLSTVKDMDTIIIKEKRMSNVPHHVLASRNGVDISKLGYGISRLNLALKAVVEEDVRKLYDQNLTFVEIGKRLNIEVSDVRFLCAYWDFPERATKRSNNAIRVDLIANRVLEIITPQIESVVEQSRYIRTIIEHTVMQDANDPESALYKAVYKIIEEKLG